MNVEDVFSERIADSERRLQSVRADLSERLGDCGTKDQPEVTIYATGSLARLEATEHSDLDAFFFLSGSHNSEPLSRIRDVKILNAVVEVAEKNEFPDFSNDGEYLRFLHIEDVIGHIGGRSDDYNNALTGRMLLILESKPLYNNELFKRCRNEIVQTYFKDFHDHSKSFRPVFLLNDILRFWRTLCLNYENGRQWRELSPERSARGHLDNLKLRFSRLNICYSFISHLLHKGVALTPEAVLETACMTPIERLQDLKSGANGVAERVDILLEEYGWFLQAVGKEKKAVLSWISDEQNRADAFSHGDLFVQTMADLVREIADRNGYLRYLIV